MYIYYKINFMNKYTVYKIICLTNNKVYIGFTSKKIDVRLKEHFKKAKNNNTNNKFSNAILKYGHINFKIESIFESDDKNTAFENEIYFIKFYNSTEKGYNTSTGGECGAVGATGRKLSEEHKEKIKNSNLNKVVSNETKALISANHIDVSGEKNPFYGKKHTEESKKKISSRYYKKGAEHHFYGKKINTSFKEGFDHPKSQQIEIDGVIYGSLTLAAKALGIYRAKLKKMYLN